MLLKVIDAEYVDSYKIELSFNNGTSGVVDLETKIFNDGRKIFEELQNIESFRSFKRNRWTLEWANGLDLAPEYLYNLMTENKKKAPHC